MELHRETERGRLSQDLVSGRLPLAGYAALLEQMLYLHRAFEETLREHSEPDGPLGAVVRLYHFQEIPLRHDLRFLGRDPDRGSPVKSVVAMLARIDSLARRRPTALLGVHYVLEGSKNGGRFIARAVRKAYEFADERGTEYLDPYGELQAERWREFKSDMESAPLSPADRDAIVEAATETFRDIMRIHAEVSAALAPEAAR